MASARKEKEKENDTMNSGRIVLVIILVVNKKFVQWHRNIFNLCGYADDFND